MSSDTTAVHGGPARRAIALPRPPLCPQARWNEGCHRTDEADR
jgi:hypothetical protein